jgi:hypothetical protein
MQHSLNRNYNQVDILVYPISIDYPRQITTISNDKITETNFYARVGQRSRLMLEALKERFLWTHTGDDGEYISDMESRLGIPKCEVFNIEQGEFYLEDSVLYYTGLCWQIANIQGQIIYFDETTNSFQWIKDTEGEFDFEKEIYDFHNLRDCPFDELVGEKGFYKSFYKDFGTKLSNRQIGKNNQQSS